MGQRPITCKTNKVLKIPELSFGKQIDLYGTQQRNKEMMLGTWNVQGIKGKVEDIIKELQKTKMDIAVLIETKKKGNEIEIIGNYIHIYSGVPKNARVCKGVSIMINKKFKNKLTIGRHITKD